MVLPLVAGVAGAAWVGNAIFGGDDMSQIQKALPIYLAIMEGSPRPLREAAYVANDHAHKQESFAANADKLKALLSDAWEGDASEQAVKKVTRLAKSARETGSALQNNGQNFDSQAAAFNDIQSQMKPMDNPPPEGSGFMDRLNPLDTDAEEAVERNQEAAKHNLGLYDEYGKTTKSNSESLTDKYGDAGNAGRPTEPSSRNPYDPGKGQPGDGFGGGDDAKRAAEEQRRKAEEAARKAREEAQRRAEEQRRKMEQEAEQRRKEAEQRAAEQRRKMEEEARRREAEARQRAEEQRRRMEQEAERRRREAEERARQAREAMRGSGYKPGSFDPSGTSASSFSPSDFAGAGAGGAGAGGAGAAGAGLGASADGRASGAVPGAGAAGAGAGAGAAGRGGMGGGRMGGGMGGMMGGAGAGGKGGEDKEHKRKIMATQDPNDLFGTDEKSVPPVIGDK